MNAIINLLFLYFIYLAIPSKAFATASLNDYWLGKATWEPALFISNYSESPGDIGAGTQITTVGRDWYIFGRYTKVDSKPSYCSDYYMTTRVSKSSDNGKTWSSPIDIFPNPQGTPQQCAATDGSAYYHAATNTWHYLYQCHPGTGGWNGCHATRSGSDPRGPFIPDPLNPVIISSSLWNKICNLQSDKCVSEAQGKVFDEGTYDIFDFDGRYYWIAFHGFDYVHGFRGIAKTEDFHTFIAGDASQGVPSDAVLNPSDATAWNVLWDGKPVGFGAGRIIKQGSYWYQFAEAVDHNLGQVEGSNWADGLFRTNNLASNSWEQPTMFRNPIITTDWKLSSKGIPPTYPNIFTDQEGQVYLFFTRVVNTPAELAGIYIYKLVPPANPRIEAYPYPLLNGSLFRGRFKLQGNAQTTSGTQLTPGDWLQLVAVPGLGDWILAKSDNRQCPTGYHHNGSFAPYEVVDYQDTALGYQWVAFCSKDDSAVLATTCPNGYQSSGWFDAPNQTSTAAHDYLGNPAGGKRLNLCIQTVDGKKGDLNNDGIINIFDYNLLVGNFGKSGLNIVGDIIINGKVDIFDYNELVGNFGK